MSIVYIFSVLWISFICWEKLRTIYLFSSSIKLKNIKCVGFYWHFHMMFLLSGCCVMDSKSSTASVNISLNSGSYRKLMQLIVEDDRKYWHRIKKSKQLSLIITLLNITKLVTNCRKKTSCYIHQRATTIRYFLYL
jgi:hypothetical protein